MTPTPETLRHTPTPWAHREGILHEASNRWKFLPLNSPYIEGAFEVGCDGHDIAEANAAFIVTAVNSHERLTARVAELEGALRDLLQNGALVAVEGCDCEICSPVARARAALSAADGGRHG